METPRRKPLAKCEKLPEVWSPMPSARATKPAVMNKLLLRQITLPPLHSVVGRAQETTGHPRHSDSGAALGFQFDQELLDAIFLFERGKAVI